MRGNYCDETDAPYLRAEGGNLAAVLLRLRSDFPANCKRVVAGVNTIFPELGDFYLEATAGNGASLLLRWHPTSNPTENFGPAHLSDGTLRMIALTLLLHLPVVTTTWVVSMEPGQTTPSGRGVCCISVRPRLLRKPFQILLNQSATLVDHFKPSEVVVADMHEGASMFKRLEEERLGHWLKRYTLGEAWRKNVFGGRPE